MVVVVDIPDEVAASLLVMPELVMPELMLESAGAGVGAGVTTGAGAGGGVSSFLPQAVRATAKSEATSKDLFMSFLPCYLGSGLALRCN